MTREDSAYPANPDSEYGWEKLFSERLYLSYARSYGMQCRVARYHNIFGPEGSWDGGREKAPAALCRKVAQASNGGQLLVWGDGEQTRSFLYVDECIEGTFRLMRSNFSGPVNIGSEEMVSINQLVSMIMDIAGKRLNPKHIPGPLGVRGRNSHNELIEKVLGWKPTRPLREGLEITYRWIEAQVRSGRGPERRQSSGIARGSPGSSPLPVRWAPATKVRCTWSRRQTQLASRSSMFDTRYCSLPLSALAEPAGVRLIARAGKDFSSKQDQPQDANL